MAFANAQLEKMKIPENIEEILQTEKSWKQKLDDTFFIEVFKNKQTAQLNFQLHINLKSNEAKGYRPYLEAWAIANGVKEKPYNWRMAQYLCRYIESEDLPEPEGEYENTLNAPKGQETTLSLLYTGRRGDFLRCICPGVSNGLRALAHQKFEEIKTAHGNALKDTKGLEAYAQLLENQPETAAEYKDLFKEIGALVEHYGPTSQTLGLVLQAAFLPRRDAAKAVAKLAQQFAIPDLLAQNRQLKEDLFFTLQQRAAVFYCGSFSGYLTKADVKKIAKRLAAVLEAFGYGIQPAALVCIIRVFENASVEAIGLDWYDSNEGYSPEDFGYYDSGENETLYYNAFWDKLDIMGLIR